MRTFYYTNAHSVDTARSLDYYSSSLDAKHLSVSLGIPMENLCITKCHTCQYTAHLAVSNESVSCRTNKRCLCKLSSPFTMGLYGSQYDYIIHIALIATSQVLFRSHSSVPPHHPSHPPSSLLSLSLFLQLWLAGLWYTNIREYPGYT